MKRVITTLTMAVAAVTIAAGTVSAQTMKAEIPFTFHVGKKLMQPGEYRVRLLASQGGAPVFVISNQDTPGTVLALSQNHEGSMGYTEPKLSFACGGEGCQLTKLSTGSGDAYTFDHKPAKNGESRLSEIALRPDRAN